MRLLIILAIGLLSACAGTPPEHSTYLLRSDKGVSTRQLSFEHDVYLGGLSLANYIDKKGLALDNGGGKIHTAKYHEWAEPLRVSLRQFFSSEISSELGFDVPPYKPGTEKGQRIDIKIDQLHGDNNGQAILVAYWSVSTSAGTSSHQFADSLALETDGYDALVAAERVLLERLASNIARSIQQ